VIRVCLTPSPADKNSTGLTPTLRRQDHTTWHVRSQRVRQSAAYVHRIPPPNVRDDRERPSSVGRDGGNYKADLDVL
jgi:hypothetical protein